MANGSTSKQLNHSVSVFLREPCKMLIGGRWVEAASGKSFESYNPATGEVQTSVPEGDREDTESAVIAARKAFVGASQSVFAYILNVSPKVDQSWEHGARRPANAALKLLSIAQSNPQILLQSETVSRPRFERRMVAPSHGRRS